MPKKKSVYNSAIEISEEYLGPAGKRFLQRQIDTHLHIKPQDLNEKNIVELVDWVKLAVSLLTDDKEIVEEFTTCLLLLSEQRTAAKTKVKHNG